MFSSGSFATTNNFPPSTPVPPAPPFALTSADNGDSVDPVSRRIVLGQSPGAAGNPGAIFSNRQLEFIAPAVLSFEQGGLVYGYIDPTNGIVVFGNSIFGINDASIQMSPSATQINGLTNLTFVSNHIFLQFVPPAGAAGNQVLTRQPITQEVQIIVGATGSFTTVDGKTVTVTAGIITAIV